MTYRQEMGRLAQELGKLLVDGGRVPEYDLPDALAEHTAVIRLLTTVHSEVAATPLVGLGNLGYRLAAQPQIADLPSGFGAPEPTATEAGAQWRNVAAWATQAEREWETATMRSRPVGKQAWTEIADLGAVAEAIGVLNGDLTDSLAEARRWPAAGPRPVPFGSGRPR